MSEISDRPEVQLPWSRIAIAKTATAIRLSLANREFTALNRVGVLKTHRVMPERKKEMWPKEPWNTKVFRVLASPQVNIRNARELTLSISEEDCDFRDRFFPGDVADG